MLLKFAKIIRKQEVKLFAETLFKLRIKINFGIVFRFYYYLKIILKR